MGKSHRPNKANAKGRNANRVGSDGAVIMLLRSLWLSPQVAALDPTERTLIVEMTALYTGPKPVADIFLSVRDAARRCGVVDHHAILRAFATLERLGFITEVVAGRFATKGGGRSKARGWRLNWKTTGGGQRKAEDLPKLDFATLTQRQRKRIAERSAALDTYRKSNFSVGESTTMAEIRADMLTESVGESTTVARENGSFASSRTVVDSAAHITSYQGGTGVADLRQRINQGKSTSFLWTTPFRPNAAEGACFCDLIKMRRAFSEPDKMEAA